MHWSHGDKRHDNRQSAENQCRVLNNTCSNVALADAAKFYQFIQKMNVFNTIQFHC